MQNDGNCLQCQCLKKFLSCCLCLTLGLGYGIFACASAGAQQPNATSSASVTEKRFRWTTTGKVYLRYGGIQTPQPTKLFGFKAEGEELTDEERSRLFQSYNAPLLETDDLRLDLYELLLGVEARTAREKKWRGKARVALDVFELGEHLSNSDWGGRLVEGDDFDSAGVREAFVSLSRAKVGELRLGITEGVVRRLDAGASEISAGNGFFGDVSQTPWHIQQLGWELGSAASDNFPKIQYLAPKFYGISIGTEWFSNLRSPNNRLESFSRDSSSFCFPSLFYRQSKKLFEEPEKFNLYDSTVAPLSEENFYNRSNDYSLLLQKDLLPDPVSEAGCWQRSATGSSWHEDARPSVMGGNFAVAYEKDFSRKKLSLKLAARYGVRSSKAKAIESDEVLTNLFVEEVITGDPSSDEPSFLFLKINRKASQLEQAAGFSAGLTWQDYSFFGSVAYQFPVSISLENVGGETFSEKGIEALLWSVGIKVSQLIPHKKGGDGKRKKKGTLSLSFTQALTKDPRYNEGKQEKTLLLNLQSLYPLTKNIVLTTDYWYGEAAVSVPFFVTAIEIPSQGVLFYERRLVPSHEILVGLKLLF